MAASWISEMITSGVQTAIQPAVASAGSFAGGTVSSVGAGINGAGEYMNGYIRRYGNGIQDYGNAIRDWTAAEGLRSQTASNPLGLSSNKVGGKQGVVGPRSGFSPASSTKFASSAMSRSTMVTSKKFGRTPPQGMGNVVAAKGVSQKGAALGLQSPR